MAKKTSNAFREVSIAEFFEKNKQFLGFDSLRKALVMAVKELVDNSLDATEEARILPDIRVEISQISGDKYKVRVEDNGPGIPFKEVPNVFGKFLYGTKFHKLKQNRGQQGIGAAAVTLYSQLTTGKPIRIWDKPLGKSVGKYFEIMIDTKKNEPEVLVEKEVKMRKPHGLIVEAVMRAEYVKGKQSVDQYLKLTAVANPHAEIVYKNPKGEIIVFKRGTDKLPPLPKEIKPHPHGLELGQLKKLAKEFSGSLLEFLVKEFSSVGEDSAKEILARFCYYWKDCKEKALTKYNLKNSVNDFVKNKDKIIKLLSKVKPKDLTNEQLELLLRAMRETKLRAPTAKALVPIGEDNLRIGITKEYDVEFVAVKTRKPKVYSGGIPFLVEAAIAYGNFDKAEILRFANRVPLLYKAGECAITKAIKEINWKRYGFEVEGDLPKNALILVHVASVKVPYTSESKEAIADIPEIREEIKRALQEVARQVQAYIRKREATKELAEKYLKLYAYGIEVERYLPKLVDEDVDRIVEKVVLERLENDLKEMIKNNKNLMSLIKNGEYDSALRILKKIVNPLIRKKIINEEFLRKIIKEVAA